MSSNRNRNGNSNSNSTSYINNIFASNSTSYSNVSRTTNIISISLKSYSNKCNKLANQELHKRLHQHQLHEHNGKHKTTVI